MSSLPAKQVSSAHPLPRVHFSDGSLHLPEACGLSLDQPACLDSCLHLLSLLLLLPLLHTLSPWVHARSCKSSQPGSCSTAASRCYSSGHTVLAWLPRYPEALPIVKHCCCRKTEKSADLVRHSGILKEEMVFYSKAFKENFKTKVFLTLRMGNSIMIQGDRTLWLVPK